MRIRKLDLRSNLDVLPAMEHHILKRVQELGKTSVRKFLHEVSDPQQLLPLLLLCGVHIQRAVDQFKKHPRMSQTE